MRWMAMVAGVMVLAGAGMRMEAQATGSAKTNPAKTDSAKPAPMMVGTGSPAAAKDRPVLPEAFAGWVATDKPKVVTDAAELDSANAAALKEYGNQGGMIASYKRSDETLTVKTLSFQDVSGAYGAYSFYRQNGWPKAEIGTGGTSDKNRVLFWKGGTVVDATFSKVGPMSASELRALAKDLPKDALDKQTTHFAQGPSGYAGCGGVLPPELVGFDRDAETVTANYSLTSGLAVLTLIDYPTPQMAEAQYKKIHDYIKAGSGAQPAFPKPLQDSDQASLEVLRSGPIVALMSGDAVPDESHKLLAQVHYSAELTQMTQAKDNEIVKTGQFLMGVAMLVIVGCSAAVLLGFFLGGGRALYRVARGRPVSSVYEVEFIRLHLED
jgi:hypothetical protein